MQDVDVDDQDDAGRRPIRRAAVSRRGLARGVAGVTAGAVALAASSGVVSAGHATHTPDAVEEPVGPDDTSTAESLLERYKPSLLTYDLEVEPSAIHGFVVRANDEDATALTYWVEYPVQLDDGFGGGGYTSHIGDHEPFYVFIENEGLSSESIDRVIYSGYHWMAAESTSPPLDGTQPRAYVYPEYHHYVLGKARNDAIGTDYPLEDLTSSLPRWLADEDFHDALSENWRDLGSPAYNPWLMRDKASWWRQEGLSNFEQGVRELWLWFGIRGARGSDL